MRIPCKTFSLSRSLKEKRFGEFDVLTVILFEI